MLTERILGSAVVGPEVVVDDFRTHHSGSQNLFLFPAQAPPPPAIQRPARARLKFGNGSINLCHDNAFRKNEWELEMRIMRDRLKLSDLKSNSGLHGVRDIYICKAECPDNRRPNIVQIKSCREASRFRLDSASRRPGPTALTKLIGV